MFEYIRTKNRDEYSYYLFKEKLSNNQTLEMKFWDEDDYNTFYITVKIYSKRKHNNTDFETTGKVGIESLLLAKLGIKLFIEFLDEQNIKNKKIVISWSDSRRRKVYYRGLKNLGFKFEYLEFGEVSKKFLTKDI